MVKVRTESRSLDSARWVLLRTWTRTVSVEQGEWNPNWDKFEKKRAERTW
jgi:hypothetical protein